MSRLAPRTQEKDKTTSSQIKRIHSFPLKWSLEQPRSRLSNDKRSAPLSKQNLDTTAAGTSNSCFCESCDGHDYFPAYLQYQGAALFDCSPSKKYEYVEYYCVRMKYVAIYGILCSYFPGTVRFRSSLTSCSGLGRVCSVAPSVVVVVSAILVVIVIVSAILTVVVVVVSAVVVPV